MKHRTVVEKRLDFLQIDEATVTTLRKEQVLFEGAIDDLLDKFYSHILQQPELKSLFSDDESVQRARNAQKRHWLETLFSMNPGKAQSDRAERIGQAHVRVGLTPGSYMGGYCFMLNQFVELVADRYKNDPSNFCRTIQALNKIVFMDMDFVIDSYLDTKDKVMRELLGRATQFTDDVKRLQQELASTAHDLETKTESFAGKGANAQDVLQCSTKLSHQVGKLDSRLVQLETEDKLYICPMPSASLLTRIKAFVENHLPGHSRP